MRAPPSARLNLCPSRGSRRDGSIPLDDALAARRLQAGAEYARLALAAEGNLRPIVGALVAEIGPPNDRLAITENGGKLLLQRLVGSLCICLAPLRGHLHCIGAARGTARAWRRRRKRRAVGASRLPLWLRRCGCG